MTEEDLRSRIDRLIGVESTLEKADPPANVTPPALDSSGIIWMIRRHTEADVSTLTGRKGGHPSLLGMLLTRQYGEWAGDQPAPESSSVWFSQFCHRLTARAAVDYAFYEQTAALRTTNSLAITKTLMAQMRWRHVTLLGFRDWLQRERAPERAAFQEILAKGAELAWEKLLGYR
ncbi:hypothetical protein JCM10908_000076 [Rhodotorula pacifica]|uniref:uncharacterized protein n=1 Tax=Rhodotorula pacifica TaxID=1495444 RepID=UPI0031801F86